MSKERLLGLCRKHNGGRNIRHSCGECGGGSSNCVFLVEKRKENKKFSKLTLQKRTAQLFPQRTCFRVSHVI